MAYPPAPGNPTPTPTPRPVEPGYVSPADYMDTCIGLLEEEDQNEEVQIAEVLKEYERIRDVMRNAEL